MTINDQFGEVDAHGATIRAKAALPEAQRQAIIRDVLTAGDFWGGAGSVVCQEFIAPLGRNFPVIYEQANATGPKCKPPSSELTRIGQREIKEKASTCETTASRTTFGP